MPTILSNQKFLKPSSEGQKHSREKLLRVGEQEKFFDYFVILIF